jgi:hypothetical protein
MSPIDRYLHDLARQLPPHARAETLSEIRSHLLELTDEWRRNGLTDAQAQARAIAQFGGVRAIGRQLRAAHGHVGWVDVVLAALPVLGITGLGWHTVGQHLPLWWYLLVFGWGALIAWRRNWPTWWYAWLGWLFLALVAVDRTSALFFIIFPLAITLVAIERWCPLRLTWPLPGCWVHRCCWPPLAGGRAVYIRATSSGLKPPFQSCGSRCWR